MGPEHETRSGYAWPRWDSFSGVIERITWEHVSRFRAEHLWGGSAEGWLFLVRIKGPTTRGTAVRRGKILALPPELVQLARAKIERLKARKAK